jgi:glycerol-3-phosphate acyltransferase PlsY
MGLSDPRGYGSKNAGATNVMRGGNKKAALFTLLGDFLKGLLVILIARLFTRGMEDGNTIVGISGILVVIGHIYPIFFKFRGGKGVATAIGVLLGFNPLLAILTVITWLITFKLSKISSLSAIVATLLAPLFAYILVGNTSYFGATTMISCFLLFKHRDNVLRLIRGTEHRFTSVTKDDNAGK